MGFRFIPPQLKLAMVFTNMARKHGPTILHSNNPDLLTKDLGNAMREQKNVLSDPRKGAIMTAYDVLPVILEVKILSLAVAGKLGISTKGKSTIALLDEIVAKSEERNGGKYARDIKDTLEWTRALFANPEIQDVLQMEMTPIEAPGASLRGITKFFTSLAGRSQDELTRVQEFLKRAKEQGSIIPPAQQPQPPVIGDTQPEAKKPEPKKPQPPKGPQA
ncbi:MAG: hypothetical protein GC185_07190 [Alphaproteobacteria bacterium]|nr:hypothetical protein [Alphaproteobacteria bacterium]